MSDKPKIKDIKIVKVCENQDGKLDCFDMYNCCSCGGKESCGCRYCFDCHACDVCKEQTN